MPKPLVKLYFWSKIAVLPKPQRVPRPCRRPPPEPLQIMCFVRFELLGPQKRDVFICLAPVTVPTKAQFCHSAQNPSKTTLSQQNRCFTQAPEWFLRGPGPQQIDIEKPRHNQRRVKRYDRNLNAQIFQRVRCKLCSLSSKRSLPRRSGRSPLG